MARWVPTQIEPSWWHSCQINLLSEPGAREDEDDDDEVTGGEGEDEGREEDGAGEAEDEGREEDEEEDEDEEAEAGEKERSQLFLLRRGPTPGEPKAPVSSLELPGGDSDVIFVATTPRPAGLGIVISGEDGADVTGDRVAGMEGEDGVRQSCEGGDKGVTGGEPGLFLLPLPLPLPEEYLERAAFLFLGGTGGTV